MTPSPAPDRRGWTTGRVDRADWGPPHRPAGRRRSRLVPRV